MASKATKGNAPMHRIGMSLSTLCLVHCIALPWLMASLPLVMLTALPEAVRSNEWLHAVLIIPVLLVSGPVLLRDQAGRMRVAIVIGAFVLMVAALFVEDEAGEQAMTVAGAVLLMAGHWTMLRRGHRHAEPFGNRNP